jgi:hypothetical protein
MLCDEVQDGSVQEVYVGMWRRLRAGAGDAYELQAGGLFSAIAGVLP